MEWRRRRRSSPCWFESSRGSEGNQKCDIGISAPIMGAMNGAGGPNRGEDLLRHLGGGRRITGGIPLLWKAGGDIHGRWDSDAHSVDEHIIGGGGGHPAIVHIAGGGIVLSMAGIDRRAGIDSYVAGYAPGGLPGRAKTPGIAGRLGGPSYFHITG